MTTEPKIALDHLISDQATIQFALRAVISEEEQAPEWCSLPIQRLGGLLTLSLGASVDQPAEPHYVSGYAYVIEFVQQKPELLPRLVPLILGWLFMHRYFHTWILVSNDRQAWRWRVNEDRSVSASGVLFRRDSTERIQ